MTHFKILKEITTSKYKKCLDQDFIYTPFKYAVNSQDRKKHLWTKRDHFISPQLIKKTWLETVLKQHFVLLYIVFDINQIKGFHMQHVIKETDGICSILKKN